MEKHLHPIQQTKTAAHKKVTSNVPKKNKERKMCMFRVYTETLNRGNDGKKCIYSQNTQFMQKG